MPLHRHECESCGHRFRILVTRGTEDDVPACPECGSVSTRRLMPLVAVQFKGSGFYKTDHGRKHGSRSDKSGPETGSKGSAEAKPSGDSKGADGSESSTGSEGSPKASTAE